MITDWIVSWFLTAVDSVFSLLPTFSPPSFLDPSNSAIGDAEQFSQVVPLDFIFTCIGISLLMTVFLAAWDGVFFVYHQFWGSD